MMARPRARLVSLLVALSLFAALATGCLLWYAASDPLADSTTEAGPCKPSEKLCVGSCVQQNDPAVGCSGECNACDLPANGQATCVLRDASEVCALGSCNVQFADCDHDAENGCEANTTDQQNCGRCGLVCPKFCAPVGAGYECSETCDASLCGSACDPDSGTGCACVDLSNNFDNCGACQHSCSIINGTGTCSDGGCTYACNNADKCPNADGTKCISVDLTKSPNCGACGTTCVAPQQCCTHGGVSACGPPIVGTLDSGTSCIP